MNSQTATHLRSFPWMLTPTRTAAVLLSGLLLVFSSLWAQPTSAQIVPGGSTVQGKTIGDWGFEWWQWVWKITSPDPQADTTGQFQYANQEAPVWMTCGAAGAAGGVPVTRRFTVPSDQYILVALFTGGVWYEPGVDPADICINLLPSVVNDTSTLSFSLDGVPISGPDLFLNHREPSSLNQTAVVVPGNPYATPGQYPGSCSDGYYVMVEPLSVGTHEITCGFTHPYAGSLNHTNIIDVVPPAASVPSMSPVGLVVLVSLLSALAIWAIRHQARNV